MNSLTLPRLGMLQSDMYQLTMLYAYWKSGTHNKHAVFDLFFRKTPFGGEFAVFAGLSDVLSYLENFRFTAEDIEVARELLPHAEPAFFVFLSELDASEVKIYAQPEGSLVFPRTPLIRGEGPLGVLQYMETTSLNLVNYATLVATNAARFRLAAGPTAVLMEFGMRRAQGLDGALTASKYTYLGGFDYSSNMRSKQIDGVPCRGTHAHAFVSSFTGLEDITSRSITMQDGGVNQDFVGMVLQMRRVLGYNKTNDGELAAFISYAQAFPSGFLALVDTYDTLKSGIPNYICVASALGWIGLSAQGIRLDSGDLAYLSKEAKKMILDAKEKTGVDLSGQASKIVASNDITEDILLSLKEQGHAIDVFGIGTHLVTCLKQPALGGVYKLVSIDGKDRIKLSQEKVKITIPGRKKVFRLFDSNSEMIADVMVEDGNAEPEEGQPFLLRDPFDEYKQMVVVPYAVESRLECYWDDGLLRKPTLQQGKDLLQSELKKIRPDHLRFLNPTPYKVSVGSELFDKLHSLWKKELVLI